MAVATHPVAHEGHALNQTHADVTRDVVATLGPASRGYVLLLLGAVSLFLIGVLTFLVLIKDGLGHAGYNPPIFWSVYITTFVFWVGIGHAGTLISAILFLFRSPWRTAVYRSTEVMTVFAVMTAGLFPIIHIGRQWIFYWLLPYPNQRFLWPNFKSPLIWDVFAISTYLTVSTTFLVFGLVPDVAAVRDRLTGWRKSIYSLTSVGWRGTNNQWRHYSRAYLYLAALATPLVLSVHSVVSWDFASGIVPGWHGTIFAPYFVVGAIYSGTAGIVTVMFLLRKYMSFERYITQLHFDNLGKLLLALSLLWTYINVLELFTGWYSGASSEVEALKYKMFGYYAPLYWEMILFCAVAPLLLISKRFRTSLVPMLILSIAINIGMYTERFLIVGTSLSRKYLPDAWGLYVPSPVELSILVGSVALFSTLFLIFVKIFPSVSIYEVKETLQEPEHVPEAEVRERGGAQWQPAQ